jgi:hypothetical protein
VSHVMALLAVPFRGERRAGDAVAEGAGSLVFLRGAVPGLAVIQRLARLREDLRMARGAIVVDALEVLLVAELDVPVFAREQNRVRRNADRRARGRFDFRSFFGRVYLRSFDGLGAFFLYLRPTASHTDNQHYV